MRLCLGMFNRDKTGTVDIHEFEKLYSYINQWLAVFKTYDRDASGHIDEAELSQGKNTKNGKPFSKGRPTI